MGTLVWRTARRLVIGVLVTAACAALASSAAADPRWRWPLDPVPELIRPFVAPTSMYGAGHRGVDLLGTPGVMVTAVDSGTVRFSGTVAGTPVLSIGHGTQVSTYQPVAATVQRGDEVVAGQPVGRLVLAASHCAPRACLHLGRRTGADRTYADPMDMFGTSPPIRLVTPYGDPPRPPVAGNGAQSNGSGELSEPVDAPVTSAYGMRMHPITGVFKLHDGTDFGAACGTPVRSAAAGTVTFVGADPAYGNRVVVDHGRLRGVEVATTYNHLSSSDVPVGTPVRAGQPIAVSGTTGYSTGCHLHFMVLVDGDAVDPMSWL
ncbi:MAG: peptidoglycan DD-metalloendopeptidase family protein [Nocardioidaceae bacterium]